MILNSYCHGFLFSRLIVLTISYTPTISYSHGFSLLGNLILSKSYSEENQAISTDTMMIWIQINKTRTICKRVLLKQVYRHVSSPARDVNPQMHLREAGDRKLVKDRQGRDHACPQFLLLYHGIHVIDYAWWIRLSCLCPWVHVNYTSIGYEKKKTSYSNDSICPIPCYYSVWCSRSCAASRGILHGFTSMTRMWSTISLAEATHQSAKRSLSRTSSVRRRS